MADQKITSKERLEFALPQVGGALKWIALSGTATYFLTELLGLIEEISLPTWAVLVLYVVINTLLYAVDRFIKGVDSK